MAEKERKLVVSLKDIPVKITHGGAIKSRTLINDETVGAKNFALLVNSVQAGLNCNYTGQGHKHDEESCMYVLSGTGGISIDGTKYELKPGDAVYIPPQAVHFVWADESGDFTYIMLYSPQGPEKNL